MSSMRPSEQYANMPWNQYLQTEEGQRYTQSENNWQQYQRDNPPGQLPDPQSRPTQGGGRPQGGPPQRPPQGGRFGQPQMDDSPEEVARAKRENPQAYQPVQHYGLDKNGRRVETGYGSEENMRLGQQSRQPQFGVGQQGPPQQNILSPSGQPNYGGGQPQGGQQGRPFVQPFYGSGQQGGPFGQPAYGGGQPQQGNQPRGRSPYGGQQGGQSYSAPAKPVQFASALPVQMQVDPNDSTRMINMADWAKKSRGGNGQQQGGPLSYQPSSGVGQPQDVRPRTSARTGGGFPVPPGLGGYYGNSGNARPIQ